MFDQKLLSQEREEEGDTHQALQESVANLSGSPREDAEDSAALNDATESVGIIPEMQNPNPEAFSSGHRLEQEMTEPDPSGS